MALAEALSKSHKAYQQTHFICAALKFTVDGSFTDDDVAAYVAALDSTDTLDPMHIPSSRISVALKEEGIKISASTIERHRKHVCSCHKAGS
jgi:hypothetical protein